MTSLLVKGSRGMKMENVIKQLLKEFGEIVREEEKKWKVPWMSFCRGINLFCPCRFLPGLR